MAKTKISGSIIPPQEPKTFNNPDIIQEDFISQDEINDISVSLSDQEFTKEEYLQQIAYYAEELVTLLHQGIYIGGHASQVRDQLYEVVQKYKS